MSVPPGASYRVSNAIVTAKRRLLNLEDPVRIQFKQEWKEGNPLFDWYDRRSSRMISKIQLRKESEGPFFHEYIAFELRDQGGYFRIDRRQLPDEHVPLDCLSTSGVEAYDTIEQIESLDDRSYSRSNCLVEVEFHDGAQLARLLAICRAIHQHPHASVYTLQRYNCYFFAQAILLCITRSILDGESVQLPGYKLGRLRRHVKIYARSSNDPPGLSSTDITDIGHGEDVIRSTLVRAPVSDVTTILGNVLWAWDEKKRLEDVRNRLMKSAYHKTWAAELWGRSGPSSSLAGLVYRQFNRSKVLEILKQTHEKILEERLKSLNSSMTINLHMRTSFKQMSQTWGLRHFKTKAELSTSTYESMQAFIGALVIVHSVRVEQYAFILKSRAVDVSKDIKATMEDIWRTVNCWDVAWIF